MLKGKKVLVTGGGGFVGANLVTALLKQGACVRATLHVRDARSASESVEYVRCDLRDPGSCRDVCRGMEYVVLAAAATSGAAVIEKTPLAHLTPNVVLNSQMLEAAYEMKVQKVVFISSNTVYPLTDFAVKEDDVTNLFYDKYFIVGWMKRFSEIMCEMYSTRVPAPMTTIVLRPANIYGPLDNFDLETSHVLPALIRKVVEKNDPIEVWGDGNDVKDFIYVDDFVDGVLRALVRLNEFAILNLSSGKGYRLRDLLRIILKIEGREDARIVYNDSKPSMIPLRLIDPTKAKYLLNFVAMTPVEEGLRKTIDWYKSIARA